MTDDNMEMNIAVAKKLGYSCRQIEPEHWRVFDKDGKSIIGGWTETMAWEASIREWATDLGQAVSVVMEDDAWGDGGLYPFMLHFCTVHNITPRNLLETWLQWK